MACLEMYNNSDPVTPPPPTQPMSPRISFSNDFAESSSSTTQHQQYQHHHQQTRESPPVSSDFEFNTTVSSTLPSSLQRRQLITASADELFFKGMILPLKHNQLMRTLRDELLAGDEEEDNDHDEEGFSLKPPVLKGETNISSCNVTGRWKGFLGLRKSHIIGSRKPAAHQPVPKLFDEPSSNLLKEDPNHSQLQHQINPTQSTYSTQRIMMCRGEGTTTTAAIASTGPADDMKM